MWGFATWPWAAAVASAGGEHRGRGRVDGRGNTGSSRRARAGRGDVRVLAAQREDSTGPGGKASLADLFGGRRQLITCHFMWRHEAPGFPGEDQGCPTCSFLVDGIGDLSHLHACDTTLVLVSRAPIASIERFRRRMGWLVPWYSSEGSDFNYDFRVSFDEDVTPIEYNYQDKATLERTAPYIRTGTDAPGISVFLRDGDRVLHTYSAYARGLDQLIGTYTYLDLTPLGRQKHVVEFPHHDIYGAGAWWSDRQRPNGW